MIQNHNDSFIATKLQQYHQQQQYQQHQRLSDSSAEFKTPLQRLHLRMKEKVPETGEQFYNTAEDDDLTSHSSDKTYDLTTDEHEIIIKQQMIEHQRRHLQKNQDQIIQQLYAIQRNSVFNAQYQQQQQRHLHRSSLNPGDRCKDAVEKENDKMLERNSQEGLQAGSQQNQTTNRSQDNSSISQQQSSCSSSYLYSCQEDYEQPIGNQKSKNLSAAADPWWKQSNHPSDGTFATMDSIRAHNLHHQMNPNSDQIYPIALRLFCEKYNRECVVKFVDDDKDNKEFRRIPGNIALNGDTQFACEIVLDGVKFGVMRGRSKKEAKNQAAKKAVQRLMEMGVDKQQRMFFEKYLQSVNDSNQRFTSMALQSQFQHQEQIQMIQQQKEQLQKDEEVELTYNYTQELSLFAHKTLRKPVSWETIFQIYSKSWLAIVYVGNLTETGCGSSKKSAKNIAALKLLKRCKQLNMKEEIIQSMPKTNEIANKNNAGSSIQAEKENRLSTEALNSEVSGLDTPTQSDVPENPARSTVAAAGKNGHKVVAGYNLQQKTLSKLQNYPANFKTGSAMNNYYLTHQFHNSSSSSNSSVYGNNITSEFSQSRKSQGSSSSMNNSSFQNMANRKSHFKGVNSNNFNNSLNLPFSNQRYNITDKSFDRYALGDFNRDTSNRNNLTTYNTNNNYNTNNTSRPKEYLNKAKSMISNEDIHQHDDKENQNISNIIDFITNHQKTLLTIPVNANESTYKEEVGLTCQQEIIRDQSKKENNDPRRKLQALQQQQKQQQQEQKEQQEQQQQQHTHTKDVEEEEEDDEHAEMSSEQRQLHNLFRVLDEINNKKRKLEQCSWSKDDKEEEAGEEEHEVIVKKNKQNELE